MKKLTCGNEPWIKEILPKPHTIMDLRSLHIDKIISQWDIQIWNRNQSTTAVPMVGPVLIWQASCLPWLDQSFNPALPPCQVTKLPTWISQVPQPTCFSSQVPDLAQCPPRSTHLVFHLAQQNREWERLQLGWRDQFALKLKLSNPRRWPKIARPINVDPSQAHLIFGFLPVPTILNIEMFSFVLPLAHKTNDLWSSQDICSQLVKIKSSSCSFANATSYS